MKDPRKERKLIHVLFGAHNSSKREKFVLRLGLGLGLLLAVLPSARVVSQPENGFIGFLRGLGGLGSVGSPEHNPTEYFYDDLNGTTIAFFDKSATGQLQRQEVDQKVCIKRKQAGTIYIHLGNYKITDVPLEISYPIAFEKLVFSNTKKAQGTTTPVAESDNRLLGAVLNSFNVLEAETLQFSGFILPPEKQETSWIWGWFGVSSQRSLGISLQTKALILENTNQAFFSYLFTSEIIARPTVSLSLTNVQGLEDLAILDSKPYVVFVSLALVDVPDLKSIVCQKLEKGEISEEFAVVNAAKDLTIPPPVLCALANTKWSKLAFSIDIWNKIAHQCIPTVSAAVLEVHVDTMDQLNKTKEIPDTRIQSLTLRFTEDQEVLEIEAVRVLFSWVGTNFKGLEVFRVTSAKIYEKDMLALVEESFFELQCPSVTTIHMKKEKSILEGKSLLYIRVEDYPAWESGALEELVTRTSKGVIQRAKESKRPPLFRKKPEMHQSNSCAICLKTAEKLCEESSPTAPLFLCFIDTRGHMMCAPCLEKAISEAMPESTGTPAQNAVSCPICKNKVLYRETAYIVVLDEKDQHMLKEKPVECSGTGKDKVSKCTATSFIRQVCSLLF
ncbi:hypothetical protein NEDG_01581 [Nematocida displodere]|uniref:RING-type domain-containing protein n=1 Tax=Nematocida displodere TaxID=1805483 RepID=A0A177EH20_9MICR|nr:hypothetical protein NEDG_01581 [Nematocida displodere]